MIAYYPLGGFGYSLIGYNPNLYSVLLAMLDSALSVGEHNKLYDWIYTCCAKNKVEMFNFEFKDDS